MNDKLVLHILRNPFGYTRAEIRKAQLEACKIIEENNKWASSMLEWCRSKGLDTTVYMQ